MMNKYYYIKENKIEEIQTVKSKEYIEKFLRIKCFKKKSDIKIDDNFEIKNNEIVEKLESLKSRKKTEERQKLIEKLIEKDFLEIEKKIGKCKSKEELEKI